MMYKTIFDIETKKFYNINSIKGIAILNKYLNEFYGGATTNNNLQWQWQNNSGNWISYAQYEQSLINNSSKNSKLNLGKYTIDFNKNIQINNKTGFSRNVTTNSSKDWFWMDNSGKWHLYPQNDIIKQFLNDPYIIIGNYAVHYKTMYQMNIHTGTKRPIRIHKKSKSVAPTLFIPTVGTKPNKSTIKTTIPIRGSGKILNNGGFWVIKVEQLVYEDGTVYNNPKYKDLVHLAHRLTKQFKGRHIEIPVSKGAGPHISLVYNSKCVPGKSISFNINKSHISEYGDGKGGGYITLSVKKQHPFGDNTKPGLIPNDPGFRPHITIGRVR